MDSDQQQLLIEQLKDLIRKKDQEVAEKSKLLKVHVQHCIHYLCWMFLDVLHMLLKTPSDSNGFITVTAALFCFMF